MCGLHSAYAGAFSARFIVTGFFVTEVLSQVRVAYKQIPVTQLLSPELRVFLLSEVVDGVLSGALIAPIHVYASQ